MFLVSVIPFSIAGDTYTDSCASKDGKKEEEAAQGEGHIHKAG